MTVLVFLISASLCFIILCYILLTLMWQRIEDRAKLVDALQLKRELELYLEEGKQEARARKMLVATDKKIESMFGRQAFVVKIAKPMTYALLTISLLFGFAYILDLRIL